MQRVRTWYRQRDYWIRRLIQWEITIMALMSVVWFTPTPYYITAPGAAVDSGRIVEVEQGRLKDGKIFMMIVNTQPANLFWYLYAQLDPRAVLETREEFLGSIEDYPQYVELTREMMANSQEIAMAVALEQLGYGHGVRTVGVKVVQVHSDSPVAGRLLPGDVIVAVESESIRSLTDLTEKMGRVLPGTEITVRIRRDGKDRELKLPTTEHPDPERKGTAALGIAITESLEYDIPIPIHIRSGLITGPSAGLTFVLQIIDQLKPDGITSGMYVAATGTIEPDGRIGRIGGVQQKVHAAQVAGADVMFVPRDDYPEASKVQSRMPVVPVSHLRDALEWLRVHGRQAGETSHVC